MSSQISFSVSLFQNSETNVGCEGNADSVSDILIATITAINDDEKYSVDITKKFIDNVKDSIFQAVLSSKPQILKKMFDEEESDIEWKINENIMTCSIEMELFTAVFVLQKEKIDENSMIPRQISKLQKRIDELVIYFAKQIEELRNSQKFFYLEMPNWTEIEKDVLNLFHKFDPEFRKYKSEQHNTTKEALEKGFIQHMTEEQKYAAWLSLLFHTQHFICVGADCALSKGCGAIGISNLVNAKFITSIEKPRFRKFVLGRYRENSDNLLFKTSIVSPCMCNNHKYGLIGSAYVGYVDFIK